MFAINVENKNKITTIYYTIVLPRNSQHVDESAIFFLTPRHGALLNKTNI